MGNVWLIMFCLLKKSPRRPLPGTPNFGTSRLFKAVSSCRSADRGSNQGYSLVELLIVVAIIATIAALAVPYYSEMVNSAHVVAAIGDIKHIQFDIECYFASNGVFPESLMAAKIEELTDPWGEPYQYLRISAPQTDSGGKTSGKSGKGGGGWSG